MKYIVTDNNAVAIFNNLQSHSDVARSLFGKPAGAGFMRFIAPEGDTGKISVQCYGESISIGIQSRGRVDEEIINRNL